MESKRLTYTKTQIDKQARVIQNACLSICAPAHVDAIQHILLRDNDRDFCKDTDKDSDTDLDRDTE